MQKSHVVFKDLQKYFLLAVILILLAGFLYFISPFFAVLIAAGVIAIDVFPMNKLITKVVRIKALASFITLMFVIIVLVTPFTLFITYVAQEALTAAKDIITAADITLSGESLALVPERLINSRVGDWVSSIFSTLPISPSGLIEIAKDSLPTASTQILEQTKSILTSVSFGALYLIIFMLSLFYFLYEGEKLTNMIKKLIPIPVKYKDELFNKLNDLSKGIVYGVFGAAIVQGVVGGIGFYIAGIENAAFWGTITALFSPVPYIGPAIIWGPAALYLAATGEFFSSAFLFFWGPFVVGTVDNLVKPYLIGKTTAINSLAVLLTILGGVLAFGIQGLIFGPFLLTILLSFLHIYELEYEEVLSE